MSTNKRKIGFYTLFLQKTGEDEEILDPFELRSTLSFVLEKEKKDRIYDIAASNKFHLLRDLEDKDNCIQHLIFTSAKYNHRPPLINKDSAEERENPKNLPEGEMEKTHMVMHYGDDEIILLLEERQVGIPIGKLVSYLQNYCKILFNQHGIELDYEIHHALIPEDDFLHQLNQLSRVVVGRIYTEKQLLGSEQLNFSDRLDDAQQDLEITVKAKRNMSVRKVLKDCYNSFISEDSKITKLRIIGRNEDNNQVVLDTDFMKKIEYVSANISETTGIVNTTNMFQNLSVIINGLVP